MINKSTPRARNARRGKRTKKPLSNVGALSGSRQPPWAIMAAVAVIVVLIGGLTLYFVPKYREYADAQRYAPGASQPDPSDRIDGVIKQEYPAGKHVQGPQRVAYDQTPPMGGPHDQFWATCTGLAYPTAIRAENAVHSLEHGAVWITYNPDRLGAGEVASLKTKVEGQPYMLMSPYPNLSTPVALQSWGRQLKLGSVDDPRIGRFIAALRQNPNTHPEPGASCSTSGGGFDPGAPPPFDPTPPGPDAIAITPAAAPAAKPAAPGGNGGR